MPNDYGKYQFQHPNDGKGLIRISERLKQERMSSAPRTYRGQHCRIWCGKPNCQCQFDREHEARMLEKGEGDSQ
jgi:hypothetical protein